MPGVCSFIPVREKGENMTIIIHPFSVLSIDCRPYRAVVMAETCKRLASAKINT